MLPSSDKLSSTFGNGKGLCFRFAPIENSWRLGKAPLHLWNGFVALDKGKADPYSASLLQLLDLHVRHARTRIVEPLTNSYYTIFGIIICSSLFQSLLDERVGQQTVPQ